MRMIAISGGLILILAATLPLASAQTSRSPGSEQRPAIDVFLVAGQSNAVGFDASPNELPASEIDSQVHFWWRCGDPPPDDHDSMSKGWTRLQTQPLGNPIQPRSGRQYGNFGQPDGGFGPEIGFARHLVAHTSRPIAVIKVAFSGTHASGDWNPDPPGDNIVGEPDESDSRGACYRSLVSEARRALAALSEQYDPQLVGMLWVQGESDATADRYPVYQGNLRRMINGLRRDLPAAEMFVMLAVNTQFKSDGAPHIAEIVAAQRAIGESDANTVYVDTSEASIANDYHYDAAGTLEVGKRFAIAYQNGRDATQSRAGESKPSTP